MRSMQAASKMVVEFSHEVTHFSVVNIWFNIASIVVKGIVTDLFIINVIYYHNKKSLSRYQKNIS